MKMLRLVACAILLQIACVPAFAQCVIGGGIFCVQGTSGGTPTSFDPASLTNATLSLSNTKVTRTSTSIGGVRALSYKSSGKFCFSITVGSSTAALDFVGVAASSASYGAMTNGTAATYAGYWVNDGRIVNQGSPPGTIGTASSGANINIAMDLGIPSVWVQLNGGNWNLGGTANPATGVGGMNFLSATSLTAVVAFSSIGSPTIGNNFTADFSSGACAGQLPSGFTAGLTQ